MWEACKQRPGGHDDGEDPPDREHSIVHRLASLDKMYNQREVIAGLITRIEALEEERRVLELTEAWLHQAIWDLMRRKKELSDRIDRNGDGE